MISIHAIKGSPTAGDYYLDRKNGCGHDHAPQREMGRQPPGADGYYLDGHNLPGRWIGNGAAALLLEGGLDRDGQTRFKELLAGRLDGEQIGRPVKRRDQVKELVVERDVRVSAYDVTCSAPKSLSSLMAEVDGLRGQRIQTAHDLAASGAVDLLELLSARAARGHHGDGQAAPRIATSGFIAAAFDHSTSRALDPQLHTHVVVMNLVQGTDQRWSAIDSRTLHQQAITASYLYQHLLRAEMTREFGVEWGPIDRGVAEIVGVPKEVRREFSTRRSQIEQKLDEVPGLRGKARTLAAKAACLATRPVKRHADPESLRADWIARGRANGFGPEQADALLEKTYLPPPVDRRAVAERVLGEDGVTRERATFDQGTVLRELISALPPGTDLGKDALLAWTRELLQDKSIVEVHAGNGTGPVYTTRGMLAAEERVLTLATRTPDPGLAALPATLPATQSIAALLNIAEGRGLRAEQRDLAQVLLTRGRAVEVVCGPAGSGKTHGLKAAVTVWTSQGVEVRGTAVAALTAKGLQDATGAPSVSLTRLLHQPDKHLPERGVLIVDEAGMVGTHQLLRLLQAADRRDCKVVLVGDPGQLPEIEAGGAFGALTQQPYALRLDGHGRQTETWERDALHALRFGQPGVALDAYQRHDRLHIADSREELCETLVADYLQARNDESDPWQVAVLTPHRRDITTLNALIRQRLITDGALGRKAMKIETSNGPIDYRKGDQVVITRNHHDRQLLNGTRGNIRTVRRDGLVLDLTDGRRVMLEKPWLAGGDLEHGYAMTLHKAQGRTVTTSLVLADQTLSQEGGYVGLSRGTTANHLYLNTTDEHALRDCSPRPLTTSGTALATAKSRALTRSSRHDLARDLLRSRGARRSHDAGRDGLGR